MLHLPANGDSWLPLKKPLSEPLSDPPPTLPNVVKLDVGAVARLLTGQGSRRGYIRAMPTFTLAGVKYEYLSPAAPGAPADIQSWEYGQWPRVEAAVRLTAGGTMSVYGGAMRWVANEISVQWVDDKGHMHSAWLPKDNVRRLAASEWDIIEYHQCPPELRSVRWGNRLPGFLPE